MKTYICKNCGYIIETDNISGVVCPKCNESYESFETIEDSIEDNELDAIVESIIEETNEVSEERIINTNADDRRVNISSDNPYLIRNNDKCINCGQCKKTCEKEAYLSYDLNTCEKPVCIGCGKCILNCPSTALIPKHCFDDVERIIKENNKIVVAIVSPIVSISIGEVYGIEIANKIENKLVSALKQLGFDYVFNLELGQDIATLGEIYELIERLKTKDKLPLISSQCPAFREYIQIYKPELIDNLSKIKNSYSIMCNVIKECFCNLKGFDKSKIVNVAITPCLAAKTCSDIDYVITASELGEVLLDENIDINNLQEREYDVIIPELSETNVVYEITGAKNNVIAKNIYKQIMNEEMNDINQIDYDGNNTVKYSNVKIKNFNLRLATVEKNINFIKLIDDKKLNLFHYIDVYACKDGCVCGGGQPLSNIDNVSEYRKKKIEEDLINKKRYNLLNNKEIHKLYREFFENNLLVEVPKNKEKIIKKKKN